MPAHCLTRGPLAAGHRVDAARAQPAASARPRLRAGRAGAAGGDGRSRRTQIPQPYRSLLVHQRDMTLTLEAHFGGRVVLRPLSTFVSGPWYYRRVLLAQEYSGRPVEMGAIRMKLAALPRKVQAEIRRNRGAARPHPARRRRRLHEHAARVLRGHSQPRDDGRLLDARAAHALRPPHRSAARRPRHRRHRRSAAARLRSES